MTISVASGHPGQTHTIPLLASQGLGSLPGPALLPTPRPGSSTPSLRAPHRPAGVTAGGSPGQCRLSTQQAASSAVWGGGGLCLTSLYLPPPSPRTLQCRYPAYPRSRGGGRVHVGPGASVPDRRNFCLQTVGVGRGKEEGWLLPTQLSLRQVQ